MDMNFSVFQEPRGVMRIIHFIFSICAFATMCNYSGFIKFQCTKPYEYPVEYPFNVKVDKQNINSTPDCSLEDSIIGDFSSDARFFVCTGVLAMLYCLGIVLIYVKFDELYKRNEKVPLLDFLLSVFMAVLWLSSSASWANGLTGLKNILDPDHIKWIGDKCDVCTIVTASYSSLNICVVLGFLNFFLWAADLWFLYKETAWFQNPNVQSPTQN